MSQQSPAAVTSQIALHLSIHCSFHDLLAGFPPAESSSVPQFVSHRVDSREGHQVLLGPSWSECGSELWGRGHTVTTQHWALQENWSSLSKELTCFPLCLF
jgi:hypothetical protein